MSLLGFLSLFSALVGTSFSISCMKCTLNDTSSTCLDSNVTCSLNSSLCGLLYKETITGGNKTVRLKRICEHPSDCNINATASTLQGQIRIATTCCSDDYCTPAIPTFSPTSAIPNGLLCPSCMSNSSTVCETSYALQCTGDEEYCFRQSLNVTGVVSFASVIRGCATQSYCKHGNDFVGDAINGTFSISSIDCSAHGIKPTKPTTTRKTPTTTTSSSQGTPNIHKVVLTPVIVWLLLLDLLY
ncbi:phospholipase A2 inhibitor and Ly6/PLAUR domain-containing protein-like [Leptodactylus fuscus]|uniref:phospholipase A2 inhibitor and Ly6/PLAUR domain-containing protein-like n=1 Tax=Leptodactylus fuscus TaxID=238119 RepID=UPI003F4E4944